MPYMNGSISSGIDNMAWTGEVNTPYQTLLLATWSAAQFGVSFDYPFAHFCTISSIDKQQYLQWTADGRILISDIDSSTNWDDLAPDVQKTLVFAYSEPVDGAFRLQVPVGDGQTVKVVLDGTGKYLLLARPEVDDFSIFREPYVEGAG